MFRTLLLAALSLCVSGLAVAQTRVQDHTTATVVAPTDGSTGGRRFPRDRVVATSIYQPTIASAAITCGATTYTVSVQEGSCFRFSNPDSDGNPTPYDYANCANTSGGRAVASCRHGCYPTSGSGQCRTS